jgi:hypothetical protein
VRCGWPVEVGVRVDADAVAERGGWGCAIPQR